MFRKQPNERLREPSVDHAPGKREVWFVRLLYLLLAVMAAGCGGTPPPRQPTPPNPAPPPPPSTPSEWGGWIQNNWQRLAGTNWDCYCALYSFLNKPGEPNNYINCVAIAQGLCQDMHVWKLICQDGTAYHNWVNSQETDHGTDTALERINATAGEIGGNPSC